MKRIYKEIKQEVEECYDEIQHYEAKLKGLREKCDHPETTRVNYMWAPGHINPDTEVCSICGEVTPRKNPYIVENMDPEKME